MSRVSVLRNLNSPGWVHLVEGVGSMPKGHSHREPELNLIVSGQAKYILEGRQYELTPRTLTWLFPAHEHMLIAPSSDFCMWVVVFSPRLIRKVCQSDRYAILRESAPPGWFCRKLAREDHLSLEAFLNELSSLSENNDKLGAGLGYLLTKAWDLFEKSHETGNRLEVHPAVEKAVRIICENPDCELGDLSLRAGLSRSQLSRLFHAQTGATISTFRNQKRLELFLKIYQYGQRTNMLAASIDAGFGSYAQFHRVFKAFMGCGPADYRRKNK
jgi:AraC-like DNA-binding protein